MALSRFDFQEPTDLAGACQALAAGGPEAVLVAGGTDLLRDIRLGVKQPALVLSLGRLDELRGVRTAGEDLVVGPLTTMAALAADARVRERVPALAEAAGRMGSPQVRNRATVGGNLCNARPCADTVPPGVVHEAVAVLRSAAETREVPVGEFITGPGQTVRQPDEILVALRYPALPAPSGSAFVTLTNRQAVEITITSATARLTLDGPDGAVAAARVCLGSVGPTPLRGPAAEAALVGQAPTPEVLAAAAAAAVGDASPIDDFRGSAQYRRWLTEALTRRALERALARAQGGAA